MKNNRIKGERKGDEYQLTEHRRHGNNCGALAVTNCLLHRITSSQSWLTMASCQLWRRAAVGCCIVDGWVDHWFTDVSWVWWISNRTPPPYFTTTTYATTGYYTTKAPEYYTTSYDVPNYYTEAPKDNSSPS